MTENSIKGIWQIAVCLFAVVALTGCTRIPKVMRTVEPYNCANDGFLIESEEGTYTYITTGREEIALALRESAQPYSERVVFELDVQSGIDKGRRNGFLVFGDSAEHGGLLMWAGSYIGAKAWAIQPVTSKLEVRDAVFQEASDMDRSQKFHIQVTVDLHEGTVVMVIDGKTSVTSALPAKLKQITYYGFGHHKDTITHYSSIQVKGK